MTTMLEHLKAKNPKPPNGEEYFSMEADYKDAFHDCEIIVWEEVGSYQGDYFALVKKGSEYGYAVIAYGSCSGCDSLVSATGYSCEYNEESFKSVVEVLEETRNRTHWEPSKDAMRVYLTEKVDKEIEDTYMDDEERPKVRKALMDAVA